MLECKHLVKEYYSGDQIIRAVDDLSITFRDQEFVSILGPSGCGKTTLLNIIGGLDQYTSGDLIINGKSTADFTDSDWDTYRNHRIGFVFQSYNLIMHQSVLRNVELSLTLSGISPQERKERAIAALEKVGLKDQINKKPTQMSGGQMQRVAIARALVNDPEIVLADEPTGALDSKTSVQVMDLLSEIAKDRLVIMVTHNPQLAEDYSSRIVRLKDGKIVSDSNPVSADEKEAPNQVMKKPSMSFWTALSLSFQNLMTKKGRTFLTSFAGSIGIIGIGLIMSLSNGVQDYISRVENDTMSSYPITIKDSSMDMSIMLEAMSNMHGDGDEKEAEEADPDTIQTSAMVHEILSAIGDTKTNNLKSFKDYLESDQGAAFRETAKAIEYAYGADFSVYNPKGDNGLVRISPNDLLDELGFSTMTQAQEMFGMGGSMNSEVWLQMPDSQLLREENYELIKGEWPTDETGVLLAVDSDNEISDYTLYSLGLLDQDELVSNYKKVLNGETDEIKTEEPVSYKADELLGLEFKALPNADLYKKAGGYWVDMSDDEDFVKDTLKDKGITLKVTGIIKPAEKTVSSAALGGLYFDSKINTLISQKAKESAIVKEQKDNPDINIFTGRKFGDDEKFSRDELSPEQMMALSQMSQEDLFSMMNTYNENANATLSSNLKKLSVVDESLPSSISLYAGSFDGKQELSDLIADYNELMDAEDKPENILSYSDTIGLMLSGIQTVINMISYVLMGFVSVSLIVSSIMIGIITYISVLERIKEIGILRAIGASKKDIRRVFNAETFIIGLISGLIGIGLTIVLDIPISLIVQNLTGVAGIAKLPWQGGLLLVAINLVLTMIAGLIPSSIASRKNPVEALRTE